MNSSRPYAPWRDPVCLSGWALYALNRFVLAPRFGANMPFLREHFNDSLLIPAALPLLVWARWKMGLRASNLPPTWNEILFWSAVWGFLFEFLGPKFIGHSVGDGRDALCYGLGGLGAGLIWNSRWKVPNPFHF